MKKSTNIDQLAKSITKATKGAKFCVGGDLPAIDPELVIDGMGQVRFPLRRGIGKRLIERCRIAPYGKGTQTLVDTAIRKTFELDPRKFRLGEAWQNEMLRLGQQAAAALGLPAEQVEVQLYKLLVYEKGGFFVPHRDSEKLDRMVGSLIVVLPNEFHGGALIVRHAGARQSFPFTSAAGGKLARYAAFFADCQHEVERVGYGHRICLAYNLVLQRAGKPKATGSRDPQSTLVDAIRDWTETQPANPLVFALAHHYTERGLSLDLLKGADRDLAELLVPAADKADCCLNLAQVTRHLMQFADDGSFGSWDRYSRYDRRASSRSLEIGETYEDKLSGGDWTTADGIKQPWGEIGFDLSAIVSSIPLDDWKPTSEEFEGYTGNAGNTLDRWYHRSAIVLWRRDQHFDVIARSGLLESIPLFSRMVSKLAKTPKKRREAALRECIHFARAIVDTWSRRRSHAAYYGEKSTAESVFDRFRDQILTLHDQRTIADFLAKVAEQDQELRLEKFISTACREFGAASFAPELKRLLTASAEARRRQEIPLRDVNWLATFCREKTDEPDRLPLARELCALAVKRFCEPFPSSHGSDWVSGRRKSTAAEESLPALLQALVASGDEENLERMIRFVEANPKEFSLEFGRVPALRTVIPWAHKHLDAVPKILLDWLNAVRRQLEAATSQPPVLPDDWTRPHQMACTCRFCSQLGSFLADATLEVGRIPAREDHRQHLENQIDRHGYDVTCKLERRGSPYALLLKKTTGSYERAVKRRETDLRLLRSLPPAG